jgi:hypothetical protein
VFTRIQLILVALCGVAGAVALVVSFDLNPGPPAGSTLAQTMEYARQNADVIRLASWLQGVGSLLNVLFALGIVVQAGGTRRLAGWVTLLSGAALLNVSLLEIAGYLTAAAAGASNDSTTATVTLHLIDAIHHDFVIAPALFLPLGLVILGSRVLPRGLGYLALVLGGIVQILGLAGLFGVPQSVVDNVLTIQELWIVAAAVMLVARGGPATDGPPMADRPGVAEPASAHR